VFALDYGISSGDNLYSVNTANSETKIPGSDFSTVDGQCLICENKKSSITRMINLPNAFKMDEENEEPTGKMESQPHLELNMDQENEKPIGTTRFQPRSELPNNIMNSFTLRNWGIPAEIVKKETSSSLFTGQGEMSSTDVGTVRLQHMGSLSQV
jgi:hypothetical protein